MPPSLDAGPARRPAGRWIPLVLVCLSAAACQGGIESEGTVVYTDDKTDTEAPTLHLCNALDVADGSYGCNRASGTNIGMDPSIEEVPIRLYYVLRGLEDYPDVVLSLRVYDQDEDAVRTIPLSDLRDGRHAERWDGHDDDGEDVTDPFHKVRLEAVAQETTYVGNEETVATLVNLPNEGTGYYHPLGGDAVDSDDWGRVHVLEALTEVGDDWDGELRIGYGDISLQNGGEFPPHNTHRHGEAIDIRYMRNDEEGPLDLDSRTARRTIYDQAATQALVDLLVAQGATEILADSRSGLEGDLVRFVSGHSDHLHVVFPLMPE